MFKCNDFHWMWEESTKENFLHLIIRNYNKLHIYRYALPSSWAVFIDTSHHAAIAFCFSLFLLSSPWSPFVHKDFARLRRWWHKCEINLTKENENVFQSLRLLSLKFCAVVDGIYTFVIASIHHYVMHLYRWAFMPYAVMFMGLTKCSNENMKNQKWNISFAFYYSWNIFIASRTMCR